MELFFGIVSILSMLFAAVVLVDKTIFTYHIRQATRGMTGKQIQEITGLKLKIYKVDGKTYYALVHSTLTMFKYRLVFYEGKLLSKGVV